MVCVFPHIFVFAETTQYLSSVRMANEIDPKVFKRFEIDRKLGRGAYGVVWKIIEKKSRKNFALKKCFDSFRNE